MKFTRLVALALAVVAPTAFAATYSLSPYQTFATDSAADAAAIGDVNGDGRNDVVVTTTFDFDEANDYKVVVFFQKADGTLDAPRKYTYHAAAQRNGLALADLDHDNQMEIIVGHGAGITILDWSPIPAKEPMQSRLHLGPWPVISYNIVVVDVDRDGALDVVAQSWSYGANVYFGDGRGGIARQTQIPTPADGYNDLESGDFNGDGHEDIVVLSGQGTTHAYLYYNDGSDDLSDPLVINPNPDYPPAGLSALGGGDFNADGRDDLVVTRDRTHVSVYSQDALGGLIQPPAILPSEWDPDAIIGHDLDLDGRDDLVVQHGSGLLGTYLQGADGLGAEVVTAGGFGTWFNTQGLAAGDINSDACPDIVTANPNDGLVVHLGNGCNAVPDLAASLGLTSTVVALRLDNFGEGDAAAPEATVALSVISGTLAVGSLPEGCSVGSQTSRTAQVTCGGPTLAAATSSTLLLPITITGGDSRNVLNASASATTTSVELRLDNNLASRLLRLGSVWTTTPTIPARTRTAR